jgi:hypothetical protein
MLLEVEGSLLLRAIWKKAATKQDLAEFADLLAQ